MVVGEGDAEVGCLAVEGWFPMANMGLVNESGSKQRGALEHYVSLNAFSCGSMCAWSCAVVVSLVVTGQEWWSGLVGIVGKCVSLLTIILVRPNIYV